MATCVLKFFVQIILIKVLDSFVSEVGLEPNFLCLLSVVGGVDVL